MSAVEVLMEAEAVGVDVGRREYGLSVLDEFVIFVSHSIKLVDSLYYTLVDLCRQSEDRKIPKYAITTIISAAGRMGQFDRAFATFTEYSTLFSLEHDVHSYNALLAATARHRTPRVISLLQILQDMESQGIQPDRASFSFLIDVMAESGDLDHLPTTLKIMADRHINALSRSIRRAAYCAVDLHKDELLPELKQSLAMFKTNQKEWRRSMVLHHFFVVLLDKKITARDEQMAQFLEQKEKSNQ
jgi:hypothetical protein